MSISFNVNLAGIEAAGKRSDPVEGYFTVKIHNVEDMVASTGRPMAKIQIKWADGAHAGSIRTTRIGIPQKPDDKVVYYWRALMESVGFSPAQLDAGVITISGDVLMGRTAHVYFKPGDRDMGTWDETKFFSPTDWSARKTKFEAEKNATGSAIAGGAVSASPANSVATAPPTVQVSAPTPGAPGVSRDSLLAALNGNN